MPRHDSLQAGTSVKNPKKRTRLTHKALQHILDWHPLPLQSLGGITSTREPADFDKHMDDQLILKHIIHLPSLTADLSNTVDTYLQDERGDPILLPSKAGFIGSRVMQTLDERNGQDAIKEIEVQTRYNSIAKSLVPIASMLAFNLSDWSTHFFRWDLSAEGVKNAIADGYFKNAADSNPPIDPGTLQGFIQIANFFPNAAVWEFKSLVSGTKEHLEDIITLSKDPGLFPWVKCSGAYWSRRHANCNWSSDGLRCSQMCLQSAASSTCPHTVCHRSYPQKTPLQGKSKACGIYYSR
jgi:hypothetical protein